MSYMFYVPTRVLFGAGQLNNLHKQAMPGKKAMLVISSGNSTRRSGALDRTTEQLRTAGVEVLFSKTHRGRAFRSYAILPQKREKSVAKSCWFRYNKAGIEMRQAPV